VHKQVEEDEEALQPHRHRHQLLPQPLQAVTLIGVQHFLQHSPLPPSGELPHFQFGQLLYAGHLPEVLYPLMQQQLPARLRPPVQELELRNQLTMQQRLSSL